LDRKDWRFVSFDIDRMGVKHTSFFRVAHFFPSYLSALLLVPVFIFP